MDERKETYKKHNAKRKKIQLSIYEADEKKMTARYGKILNATEVKKIVLEGVVVFKEKKDNTSINLMIVELKRIGNNINQLAHRANESNRSLLETDLRFQLQVLNNKIELIDNLI